MWDYPHYCLLSELARLLVSLTGWLAAWLCVVVLGVSF